MVSIRKAKQGFQLRRRGGAGGVLSQADKEKLGLVVAGMCVGVLWLIFSTTGGTSSDLDSSLTSSLGYGGEKNANNNNINNPLRHRKPHPQLVLQDEEESEDEVTNKRLKSKKSQEASPPINKSKKNENTKFVSEAFNAMALDILQTLECDKLFERTLKQLKDGGMPKDDDDDVNEDPDAEMTDNQQRRRRRRLEENQHGDDGGFQDLGDAGDGGNDAGQDDDDTADGKDEDEEEEKWGREAMGNADMMNGMDDAPAFDFQDDQGEGMMDDAGIGYATLTAKHLFCSAAMQEPPAEIVSQFSCAASGRKRKTLLDLWTSARSQISDVTLLKKVLDLAQEQKSQGILGRSYDLWAPPADTGMTYMINTLNNELAEALDLLEPSLGPDKLFVDVGSGMGLTTLAISNKYPGTKIVSMEPASPNWLLQELNLRCNLAKHEFTMIKVVLAGVGPNTDDEDNMMAKLMWRPTSTTSTRAWTPAEEFGSDDVELLVRLRKLRSILAEADVYLTSNGSTPNMMDVLNLDCQGCEYNLIPALKEEEFDAIPNVMGSVHWGYIPLSKLPSSQRGKATHDRLCQHETIATTTKECCGSLDVGVKSNVPGEVLYRDNGEDGRQEVVTVSDIIQEGLCDDYTTWAAEHYVTAIKDDWGWFELSSQAQ
jgi:FkbM family methyltransferase